jgi:hypothetical protein
MGDKVGQPPPDWIRKERRMMQIALYWGIKPWELDDIPAAWITLCGFYMDIEEGARRVVRTDG